MKRQWACASPPVTWAWWAFSTLVDCDAMRHLALDILEVGVEDLALARRVSKDDGGRRLRHRQGSASTSSTMIKTAAGGGAADAVHEEEGQEEQQITDVFHDTLPPCAALQLMLHATRSRSECKGIEHASLVPDNSHKAHLRSDFTITHWRHGRLAGALRKVELISMKSRVACARLSSHLLGFRSTPCCLLQIGKTASQLGAQTCRDRERNTGMATLPRPLLSAQECARPPRLRRGIGCPPSRSVWPFVPRRGPT